MAQNDKINVNSGWPTVDIVIQEKGDAGFEKKLSIADDETIFFSKVDKAFILKGAMTSGKNSVTLYAKFPDGTHMALETSASMLKMIADLAVSL